MDTFPVTPTLPQTFQGESPPTSSQSGNQSEFAPTLAKAMSETTGSKNENQNNATENTPIQDSSEIQENNNRVEVRENSEQVVEDFLNIEDSLTTLPPSQLHTSPESLLMSLTGLRTSNPASLLSQGNNNSPIQGDSLPNLAVNTTGEEPVSIFQKNIQQPGNLNVTPTPLSENQPIDVKTLSNTENVLAYNGISQSTKDTPATYRPSSFSGNTNILTQQTLRPVTGDFPQMHNQHNLENNGQLQQISLGSKTDSIDWSQTKQRVAHQIHQNHPVNVTYGGDTPSAKNSAAISTESVIASITDLSLETQKVRPVRQEAPSLRNDINNQYFQAKIKRPELSGQSSSQEQGFETENEQNPQNSSLNLSPKIADASSEVNFSQSLHNLSGDKLAQPAAEIFKPGMPLFNNQMFEDNLIHQVAQKFRINQQLLDSKIALKLHPAELGELKIEIQIKEGSVNASIIAQNQTVQDILEKNMPRLKALMEQNGLKVNDIVVTLDTDVPSDTNLFEDHLAQNDDNQNNKKSKHSDVAFQLIQDEEENDDTNTEIAETGVNVKV